ncbi:hypothetical protein Taro_054238 [Colocasia esculenta]|uniref:CCT domain-containing protein n=1 Tax=Colocasia esculenta TaxID=4460 RepID=A0A843XPV9_COLES|nr:hypothetical protein [Colocasia esculenta]
MYQSSAYPDSSFPQSSPPTPPHHLQYYHQHHHGGSHHLYPPSPPQGASPSSDSGSFLMSPPPSYAPSIPSSYLQRSSSALSLHKHVFDHGRHLGGGGTNNNPHGLYEPPDLFDFQAAEPIRRVFSTGDIQGTNSLQPLPTENCGQEVGGNGAATATLPGGRVGRYSHEERKERIERYRNKRSQRNFQKKITVTSLPPTSSCYACRKTLADSRPRIRGRFARNGETELEAEAEAEAGDASYGCSNSSPHAGADYNGWAPAMDDEEDYRCDPDFWANFFNNLSMNTLVPNGDV